MATDTNAMVVSAPAAPTRRLTVTRDVLRLPVNRKLSISDALRTTSEVTTVEAETVEAWTPTPMQVAAAVFALAAILYLLASE